MAGASDSGEVETFNRALTLHGAKRYREAADLFLGLLAAPGDGLKYKQIRHAYLFALGCMVKVNDWPGAEALARQAIERFPNLFEAYARLGEALMRQGRFSEAEAVLVRAIELNPAGQEAPLLLELTQAQAGEARRTKVAPWPARAVAFEDPRRVIERYLLRTSTGAPVVEPDSVFMTLGSCFALNLADHLRSTGRKAHAEEIGDDVNSTYANRYLLDWIERGPVDEQTTAIQKAYGPQMRERMRREIAESDVFVITLGVAPCFFRKSDGQFAFIVSKTPSAREHLYADHVMRTTEVDENVENIRAIMDSIARLARRTPKFVLTVSPVPLGGTTEFDSAVIADCISKSTLRLAAHRVCADPGVHRTIYWPSFEIVRWLGPHFGAEQASVFGADDGNTRHVSNWVVQLVIQLFLEHQSAPAELA